MPRNPSGPPRGNPQGLRAMKLPASPVRAVGAARTAQNG